MHPTRALLLPLSLSSLLACGDKGDDTGGSGGDDTASASGDDGGSGDEGDGSGDEGGGSGDEGGGSGDEGGGSGDEGGGSGDDGYAVDCEAVADLMVTTPTSTVDDWSGYWLCYQEENGCEGERCSWNYDDLPAPVRNENCAVGAERSCTIDGVEVPWCETRADAGFVEVDCSTDGEIAITVNGLPDHTLENYALSETLPPLLESDVQDSTTTLSTSPVYNSDDEIAVFTGALGNTAIAANGVSIFNQFTGVTTVAVTDETVDDCGGHPASGLYHYHSVPYCGVLVDRFGSSSDHSGLLGMAADGFPVFGPYGLSDAEDASSGSTRMQSCYTLTDDCDETDADCYVYDQDAHDAGDCDLDPCNGRITAVPADMQDAFGETIYAYYMTVDAEGAPAFPYLPYCFRGDAETGGGSGGGGGEGGGSGGGGMGGGGMGM